MCGVQAIFLLRESEIHAYLGTDRGLNMIADSELPKKERATDIMSRMELIE